MVVSFFFISFSAIENWLRLLADVSDLTVDFLTDTASMAALATISAGTGGEL